MQRNLDRRVEVSFPINDNKLKNELMRTLIKITLKDNTKSKQLLPDMSYKLITPVNGEKKVNSQAWLMKHSIKARGENIQM